VAVRLGRNDATLTLYDLSAKALSEQHYPLPERTQETLENALVSAITHFMEVNQRKIRELIAIAVILPGLVDPVKGIVRYMPHISVHNWRLVDILESKFNVTSFVGHDIRSLALAEHYFGATRDCQDSILVRLHRGTGAGILVNGQIFLGSNGNVGEIGHIQVDPLGERCHCGNFGCLETIAANSAIENRVRNLLTQGYPSKLSLDDCTISSICNAAHGKSIAIAINLFNPQKVVIAGEITEADKVLLPALQSCINTQVLKDFRRNLPIVTSELNHRSAIGAFALVKRAMLNGVLLQRLLENSAQ
jgi:N-acetylglucosamine repressor